MLLEPENTPLLGGLMVVSTNGHVFPVQVINLLQEDVWLSASVKLGIPSQCQCARGHVRIY